MSAETKIIPSGSPMSAVLENFPGAQRAKIHISSTR